MASDDFKELTINYGPRYIPKDVKVEREKIEAEKEKLRKEVADVVKSIPDEVKNRLKESILQSVDMTPTNDPKAGRKFDQGKTRWGLMFGMKAMQAVAEVLTYGAVKYAAYNYRYVKGWRWRYIDAALRHLFSYMSGEQIDKESGFHHLAHCACCILMLLDNELLNMPDGDVEPEKK